MANTNKIDLQLGSATGATYKIVKSVDAYAPLTS